MLWDGQDGAVAIVESKRKKSALKLTVSNRSGKGGMRKPRFGVVSTDDGRFRVIGPMMAAKAFKVEFH